MYVFIYKYIYDVLAVVCSTTNSVGNGEGESF